MTILKYFGTDIKKLGDLGETALNEEGLVDQVVRLYRTAPQDFVVKVGRIVEHTHSLVAARESAKAALNWKRYRTNGSNNSMYLICDMECIANYVKASRPIRSTADIINSAESPKRALEIAEELSRFAATNVQDGLSHIIRVIVYDKLAGHIESNYKGKS